MCDTMGMVQYEVGGGRKALVEGEKEDLLSKLRQLPRTLSECRRRMDRLDSYIQHVHTLPGNITFFQTHPGNQEDLKDIFERQTHTGKVLGHQEDLQDVFEPQMHPENTHGYQVHFSRDACGNYVHHRKALGSQARSEDALGRQMDLGKALEPQTDFEDKAVEHQIHTENAFAPLTYRGDALGTQAHPGDFVELQTHLKSPQQLDTSSDELVMHSKSLHSNTDCAHVVQLPQTVAESPTQTASTDPVDFISPSLKPSSLSFEEDQQKPTMEEKIDEERENGNAEKQKNTKVMRKDSMLEVKEAEEHQLEMKWTVIDRELTDTSEDMNNEAEGDTANGIGSEYDNRTLARTHEAWVRRRKTLERQPNIDYELMKSISDQVTNSNSNDHPLPGASQRDCRYGEHSESLGRITTNLIGGSEGAEETCENTDVLLDEVRRNSLIRDGTSTPPPTPVFSNGSCSHPPSHFYPYMHPGGTESCIKIGSDSSSTPVILQGLTSQDLKHTLFLVIVIFFLMFGLLFLACCLLLVVPVVTVSVRTLGGPAAF